MQVELVITDNAGTKHTLGSQRIENSKNYARFSVEANSFNIYGSIGIPLSKSAKAQQAAKPKTVAPAKAKASAIEAD